LKEKNTWAIPRKNRQKKRTVYLEERDIPGATVEKQRRKKEIAYNV